MPKTGGLSAPPFSGSSTPHSFASVDDATPPVDESSSLLGSRIDEEGADYGTANRGQSREDDGTCTTRTDRAWR